MTKISTKYVRKIKRKRLAIEVSEQILSLIVNGKLKLGDKLPSESVLMQQFDVGRSTIREAISALTMAGVVSARAGAGTTIISSAEDLKVKQFTNVDASILSTKINELIEARMVLEEAIVGIAALRADPEDIIELRDCLELLKKTPNDKKKQIAELSLSFHTALSKACHNRILERFFAEIRSMVLLWMRQSRAFLAHVPDNRVPDLVEHENILKAIEAHDVVKAKSELLKHLQIAAKALEKVTTKGAATKS